MWDSVAAPFVTQTYQTVLTTFVGKAGFWTSPDGTILPLGSGITVTGGNVSTSAIKHGEWRVYAVNLLRPAVKTATKTDKQRLWITVQKPQIDLTTNQSPATAPFMIDDSGTVLLQVPYQFVNSRTNNGVQTNGFILLLSASHHHALYHSILTPNDFPTFPNPYSNLLYLLDLDKGTFIAVTDLTWDTIVDPMNLFQESQIPWFMTDGYDIKVLRTDFAYACDEKIRKFVKAWTPGDKGIPTLVLQNPPLPPPPAKTVPVDSALASQTKLKDLPKGVIVTTPNAYTAYGTSDSAVRFLADIPTRNYRVVLNSGAISLPVL
jgi:hypothetical protein